MGEYHFVLQNADWAGDVKYRRSHSGISAWVKDSAENIGYLVYASFWKRSMQMLYREICLVQGQRSNSEFRETKLE